MWYNFDRLVPPEISIFAYWNEVAGRGGGGGVEIMLNL